MNKIYGIKHSNFDEFIKQINEFNQSNNVFATQIYPDFDNPSKTIWYAVIYYETQQDSKKVTSFQGNVEGEIKTSPNPKASDKQINYLKKLGYKGDTSKLTSKEAYIEIKKLTEQLNLTKDRL